MRRIIRITVTGFSPLVLKRSFWDLLGQNGVKPAELPRTEPSLEDEVYRNEEGDLALPSSMVLHVLNCQAARLGLLPKRSDGKDFTIGEKWILLLDPDTSHEAEVQQYVQPNFTAAQVERWRGEFVLEYDSELTTQQVRQAVTEAGKQIGIGAAARHPHSCGRFQVTDWQEAS